MLAIFSYYLHIYMIFKGRCHNTNLSVNQSICPNKNTSNLKVTSSRVQQLLKCRQIDVSNSHFCKNRHKLSKRMHCMHCKTKMSTKIGMLHVQKLHRILIICTESLNEMQFACFCVAFWSVSLPRSSRHTSCPEFSFPFLRLTSRR